MIKPVEVDSTIPSQYVGSTLYRSHCRICEHLVSAGKVDKHIHMVPIQCQNMCRCTWILWGRDSVPDGYE